MAGWLLALAGAGFWAGILLVGSSRTSPSAVDGTRLLVAGAAGLAIAVVVALTGRPGAVRLVEQPRRADADEGLGERPVEARRSGRGLSPGARSIVRGAAIIVSFGMLGAGWASVHDARIRASPVALMAGRAIRLWAAMETDPEPGAFGWTASARTEILFPPDSAGASPIRVSSRLWLRGQGPVPRVTAGDRVELEGLVQDLHGPFGGSLLQRGYGASLSTTVVRYRGPPSSPVLRAANALRDSLRGSLGKVLPPREAGLVMGLALGDTSKLDLDTQDDFRATGLSHLIAVSGANVAMFLAPLLGLAAWVGLGTRGRVVVGIAGVAFFVLLTRAEPSVLRAGAMTGLTLLGVFLGRPRSPPAIIGGSVLGLLAVDPTLARSIGFQLSVGATVGMAVMAGPVSERLRFLPSGLALAAGATIGAQAGVTPLLLFHFAVVPTVTLPANLLAFAAVGPAMLLGLAAGVAGLAWGPLGVLMGGLARLPLGYLEGLADRLARSPLPSITSPGGQLSTLVLGFFAVAAAGWWLRRRRRMTRRALLVVGLALPIVLWAGAVRAGPPRSLTAVFFDVGQGDAAVIRSRLGATILIDGGPDQMTVARKLASLGVRRVDVMVATHPHADHVGGLPAVLGRFRVTVALDPGCGGDSPFYTDFIRALKASGVPLRQPAEGATLQVADVRLEVLGPDRCSVGTDSDPNNDSLVIRVTSGPVSLLFPGDAEEPSQEELLEDHRDALHVAVLKVPHHGGATTTEAFFRAVAAPVAIVSVGPNRYGHPSPEVLSELAALGARVFRTDRSGDVTVSFSGGDVLIESGRG